MSAFFDFVTGEWYFAIPMFLMSLTAVTLVIWRILLNYNARTNMNEFLPAFQQKLEKEGVEGALTYCRSQTGIIPRKLYVAGLETSRQGIAAMRRAVKLRAMSGAQSALEPPLPIPNRTVKRGSADDSARYTARK